MKYVMASIWVLFVLMFVLCCGPLGDAVNRSYLCTRDGVHCHAKIEDSTDQNSTEDNVGPRGSQGIPGPEGRPGTDGSNGQQGATGAMGSSGPIGPTGPEGSPGDPAAPCSVQPISGGVEVRCPDGSSATVMNGLDAPPTPYTVDHVVDPCGPQVTYDEVLLVMSNSQVLAHFSNGSNQFLTLIPPGNYVTTDGSNCYFTVEADNTVDNEHN